MKCEEVRQRWHVCLDENRDDTEVDEHLESCQECRRYVGLMSQIVGTLDELHEATEPVVATRDFEPLVRPAPRPRVNWNVVFRRVTGIAAAIGAVIGGSLYFANNRSPIPVVRDKPVEEPVDPQLGISLQGDSVGKFLVVSKETSDADVKIYWLYPTVELADATEPF
jgi:predicted anti-sigma-YlaC factor YlaD